VRVEDNFNNLFEGKRSDLILEMLAFYDEESYSPSQSVPFILNIPGRYLVTGNWGV
jgi:hypothetical protein